MNETIKAPLGRFVLDVYRNGLLIERVDEPNLVVNGSKRILSHLLKGDDVTLWGITKIGFGTNGIAPVVTQSLLTGPFYKDLTSITLPDTKSVSFNFDLGTTENNGMAIREFGLLSGNDTLFSRKIRTAALGKTSDIELSGSWIIKF